MIFFFYSAVRRRWLARWLLAGLLLAISGVVAAEPARFSRPDEEIDRVIELVDRRLALMPEVAAWKFRRGQAVADPERERQVVDQAVAAARAIQLDPTAARAFLEVQILMARAVQERRIAEWKRSGVEPPAARDLATEIRPALDGIGRDLWPAVYLASAALEQAGEAVLRERLAPLRRHAGATDESRAQLARALAALRLTATPTWQTIQRVGVVRVGTTGDYAPFSEERSGALRGLDIQIAAELANAWGVRVVFVPTTWPTLMDDLGRRRFDLAASGITVTAERRRQADFSAPYFFDGKTPIARREDAARFSSLAGIDQPGVRVVVNPGGTNERYVREHLRRATILVHPDNRTIFAEISAGRADVMITDGIEVRLQERRRPELAGTMPTPLTRAGKAILLPPGSELTPRVDAWFGPQLAGGRMAERMERALAEAK